MWLLFGDRSESQFDRGDDDMYKYCRFSMYTMACTWMVEMWCDIA